MLIKGSVWIDKSNALIIYHNEMLSPISKIAKELVFECRDHYIDNNIDSIVHHIEISSDMLIMKRITDSVIKNYWEYKKNLI